MSNVRRLLRICVVTIASCMSAVALQHAQAKEPLLDCNMTKAHKRTPAEGPALTAIARGALSAIPLNAVQFIDRAITHKVVVQGLYARRSEVDTVEVIARLINCTDHPLQVEGRTAFMDAQSVPAEPASAWQRVFLPPRATGVYREISTATQDVSNFLIELREGA